MLSIEAFSNALWALPRGFLLAYSWPTLKLSIAPILIALVVYIFCFVAALYAIDIISARYFSELPGVLQSFFEFSTLLLILLPITLIMAMLVTLLSGIFLSSIAQDVRTRTLESLPPKASHGQEQAQVPAPSSTMQSLAADLHRAKEHIFYATPRAIVAVLLGIIPVLGVIPATVILAWLCAIEFLDCDEDRKPFPQTLKELHHNRVATMIFGAICLFLLLIPVLGIFVPAAAAAGGSWMKVKNEADLI